MYSWYIMVLGSGPKDLNIICLKIVCTDLLDYTGREEQKRGDLKNKKFRRLSCSK